MSSVMLRAIVVALGVASVTVHAGCAARGSSNRFLVNRDSGPLEVKDVKDAKAENRDVKKEAPPQPTLEEAIAKVRRLMTEVRPEKKVPAGATLETSDPELAAALAAATVLPRPDTYLELARVYELRRLLDKAYDYFTKALGLDPRLSEAHEGLARVWRDWNAPGLALGDAHRAIFYNPTSASARNTLGTVLQALGQRAAARRAYMEVLAFEPKAAYAFNNLCYLSFLDGRADYAVAECKAALRLNPTLTAARNNLALTYAAAGRHDLAREHFALAGGPATTAYNMGIVALAERRFAEAADEFSTAQELRPTFAEAGRRAIDARRRAIASPEGDE